MKYSTATKAYTQWLAGQVKTDAGLFRKQMKEKKKKMEEGVFPFLRGTFYRWAELWPAKCPTLASRDQDIVMAIGDLHLENFGTWRDAKQRLVWGVNDFDEAHEMAFTSDLVRLATSALAAAEDFSVALQAREVAARILKGYRAGCASSGDPFILDSSHQKLRKLITHALIGNAAEFWKNLKKAEDYPLSSDAHRVPDKVKRLLKGSLPRVTKDIEYRVVEKAKGNGSLGRPRYLAVGKSEGEPVAREIKFLTPSAVEWQADPQSTRLFVKNLATLGMPLRSPDPTYRVQGQWVVRALRPDAVKVKLKALQEGMEMRNVILYLLERMGTETANIHLGSAVSARLLASVKELDALHPRWLTQATEAMWDATYQDWKSFT